MSWGNNLNLNHGQTGVSDIERDMVNLGCVSKT